MKMNCVNEKVLVPFSACMSVHSHETKQVKNQYVLYTSSKEAEWNVVEITFN